jgi:putative DNA methylase
MAGRMSAQLMAIVTEGTNGRNYHGPDSQHVQIAGQALPKWKPDGELPKKHRNFQTPAYGMPNIGDLFTPRQLTALTTFSDMVIEVREQIQMDAENSGLSPDSTPLRDGGIGTTAYAEAISIYLSITASKAARFTTTL